MRKARIYKSEPGYPNDKEVVLDPTRELTPINCVIDLDVLLVDVGMELKSSFTPFTNTVYLVGKEPGG